MTLLELDALCREEFPMCASNEQASLEYVDLVPSEPWVRLLVRLIDWERDGETLTIRSVKEQEVAFALASAIPTLTHDRVQAFLRALARVLSRGMCSPTIETMMPHDLLPTDALTLKTAVTEEHFVKALGAKSRLGPLLARAGQ
jgi:hypothetical protein